MTTLTTDALTVQTLPLYRAEDFTVASGVAEGDPLAFADDLVMDDVYQLSDRATRAHLTVEVSRGARDTVLQVARGSATGTPGHRLHLDCVVTLIGRDSQTVDAIILVEEDAGDAVAVYLLPLAALARRTDYRLIGLDRDGAAARFGELGSVAFARGTHITLATGEQRRIEDLRVGDRILTRDDGAQELRWIGHSTLRAVGDFAPVLIRKGALNNAHDLRLSPDHRLFIYQRADHLGAGRSEVLVRARHLVNGDTILQQEGGYVDYFQLLFDDHHIIFAEGIAAESFLLTPQSRAALPGHITAKGHGPRQHHGYEVGEDLTARPDAAELLRRASTA